VKNNVILYIAISADGFIARENGDVDWLPQPTDASDDNDEHGYKALMARISIIVMGSKSYQQILGFGDWGWGDKTTYVFTSQPLTTERNDIFFVHDDVKSFMKKIEKGMPGKEIWLLGGAELIRSFAKEKLIDECVITVIPVNIGTGITLDLPYNEFALKETKNLSHHMTQTIYVLKK
jgi:dihydrofolate reductase